MTNTVSHPNHDQANREKGLVALSSVFAAIGLTSMKLVIGLATGSLGILSEAAHSGLDMAAAAVTLLAVRISGRPASERYTYGHGKVENLSALVETLLLLATCAWIIYEAVMRLFVRHVEVETSLWGFIIMAASIVIDFTRSRALYRVAKKYDSQALEADALHFSTDIWSSSVVIIGLGLVWLSRRLNIPWLAKADAVSALGVAGIVIYVSVQLGRRTIRALLDGVSPGLRDEVALALHVPGVMQVVRVRVRQSGPEAFVDAALTISRDTSLEAARDIVARSEAAVRQIVPHADVVVEVQPVAPQDEDQITAVRMLAARQGLGVHSIRIYEVGGRRTIELHLEVRETLDMRTAHSQASEFEAALRNALPGLGEVITHIEPVGEGSATQVATREEEQQINEALAQVLQEQQLQCHPHQVRVYRVEGQLAVSFHCQFDPGVKITEAHALTELVERELRTRLPAIRRVIIHGEPASG
ncbi:MAG TPA: cation-efflux pump [Anaerolineales bacterium]|nr:cation-efflux pump [Anaerolineales bacterium]